MTKLIIKAHPDLEHYPNISAGEEAERPSNYNTPFIAIAAKFLAWRDFLLYSLNDSIQL